MPPIKRDVYLWNRADFESINKVWLSLLFPLLKTRQYRNYYRIHLKLCVQAVGYYVPTKQLSYNINNQPGLPLLLDVCLERNDDV